MLPVLLNTLPPPPNQPALQGGGEGRDGRGEEPTADRGSFPSGPQPFQKGWSWKVLEIWRQRSKNLGPHSAATSLGNLWGALHTSEPRFSHMEKGADGHICLTMLLSIERGERMYKSCLTLWVRPLWV